MQSKWFLRGRKVLSERGIAQRHKIILIIDVIITIWMMLSLLQCILNVKSKKSCPTNWFPITQRQLKPKLRNIEHTPSFLIRNKHTLSQLVDLLLFSAEESIFLLPQHVLSFSQCSSSDLRISISFDLQRSLLESSNFKYTCNMWYFVVYYWCAIDRSLIPHDTPQLFKIEFLVDRFLRSKNLLILI